jgi:hypothetical protein
MPLLHFMKKYQPFSANIFMFVSIGSCINSGESECLISGQLFEMRGLFLRITGLSQ